jgi:hypothetical protein
MGVFIYFTNANDYYSSRQYEKLALVGAMGGDIPMYQQTVYKHWIAGAGEFDIRSYADLQRYSAQVGAIGNEKPFFHLREEIPAYTPDYIIKPPGREVVGSGPTYLRSSTDFDRHLPCGRYSHWESGEVATFHNSSLSSYWSGPIEFSVSVYPEVTQLRYEIRNGKYRIYRRTVNGPRKELGSFTGLPLDPDNNYDVIPALVGGISEAEAEAVSDESRWSSWDLITNGDLPRSWYSIYYFAPAYYGQTDLDQFSPYADYNEYRDLHSEPPGLYPQLCGEAVSATSMNSNNIANALSLFDIANSIRTGRIISDITKKGKLFEKSKDAWLKYRYAYKTSMSDFEELGRYIEQKNATICRAGSTTDKGTMMVKISISPPESEVNKIVSKLTEAGVAPNLYNLWDMVPYSFVVDWFISLGDVLEGITQYGRLAAFKINYITRSWKWDHEIERGGVKAKLVYYSREVSPTAPPYIPYQEKKGSSGKTTMMRMADAVCLFS